MALIVNVSQDPAAIADSILKWVEQAAHGDVYVLDHERFIWAWNMDSTPAEPGPYIVALPSAYTKLSQ